jgi:uncharacterized protein (TIGR00255 family)
MTGYGRAEVTEKRVTAVAEVRSVNNRFLEVTSRLPRTLSLRENDVKEIIRSKFSRGKVNVAVTIIQENENELPLKINHAAAKAYHKLLTELKATVKLKEKITLDHLLKFPEVMEFEEVEDRDEKEWAIVQKSLLAALEEAGKMRQREGSELLKDFTMRIRHIESLLSEIEQLARERLPQERARLEERVREIVTDPVIMSKERMELEIVLLADKLDLTEECVRFKSHNKFFLEALSNEEAAGRKLNFLIQEMNREANTIGSKANDSAIAHLVVGVKEELEKVREQLQNIE